MGHGSGQSLPLRGFHGCPDNRDQQRGLRRQQSLFPAYHDLSCRQSDDAGLPTIADR